jgi:hypothetical protein
VRIKAAHLESLQKNLPRPRRILKKAPDKDDQVGWVDRLEGSNRPKKIDYKYDQMVFELRPLRTELFAAALTIVVINTSGPAKPRSIWRKKL